MLARPDARRMVLIGNGAQSECQTLAFHTQLGIEELSVFDVDLLATEKLVRKLQSKNLFRFARGGGGARASLRRVA